MEKIQKFCLTLFCLSGFFLLAKKSLAQDLTQYNSEKIFYIAGYNATAGVASLSQNWQEVDIVAPQMYTVNSNLQVIGKLGPKLRKVIADHNLKVMPLVTNAGFSQKTIHNLLASASAQSNVINSLVSLAQKDKYIGWQFDFEHINYQDRDLYTAFVQKTYPVFQGNNLIFSVAASPRITDYEDTDAFKNWDGVYDYKKIADSCDFISLMTYDDNNSVGPTSSIVFINNVLNYVKDKIPASKLSLGIPLYSWKWSVASDKKVGEASYKNVLAIMENFPYNLGFDPSLGVSWLTYVFKNKEYKIWFENEQSFQEKVDIAKSDNLRGFSAWLLGGEDPGIWSVLGNDKK